MFFFKKKLAIQILRKGYFYISNSVCSLRSEGQCFTTIQHYSVMIDDAIRILTSNIFFYQMHDIQIYKPLNLLIYKKLLLSEFISES